MEFYIITSRLVNLESKKINIGGIQTYIQSLYDLIYSKGHHVHFLQICSCKCEEQIILNNFNILLVPFRTSFFKNRYQATFDYLYKKYSTSTTHFIIDTDQYDIRCCAKNVTQIQHGIAFDIPGDMIQGFWGANKYLQHTLKYLKCIKNSRRLYNTRNTVCVDYNFYNWFRTLGTIYPDWQIKVIPNYSSGCISRYELTDKMNNFNSQIKIVFARRFFDYRGTLIMIEAVKRILSKYNNVLFTFAGGGPLETTIVETFKNVNNVKLTSFKPEESIIFHQAFDVAVVPTIYSEGTSLSLSEAMSAGCVPIATHVGGMTNMILDNFNGFFIEPNVDSLVEKLEYVISMPIEERKRICTNAYESSLYSFSKKRWCDQWAKILQL